METLQRSRRKFLTTSLKAMVVVPSLGLTLGRVIASETSQHGTSEITPFVEILPDGSINLMIHKQEMGQSVRNSISILLAEELDVKLSMVNLVTVESHPTKFGRMDTGGSGTVRNCWRQVRTAGAAARDMLITAASQKWGVNKSQCTTNGASVINKQTKQKFSYAELSQAAAKLAIPEKPMLKSQNEFTLIGKKHNDVDVKDIVQGKLKYAMDVCPPNTVHATIIRCPAAEGTVAEFNASEVLKIAGVVTVKDIKQELRVNGNRAGVGVIAKNYWTAKKARESLDVKWHLPEARTNGLEGIYQHLSAQLDKPAVAVNQKGRPHSVTAKHQLEAFYKTPPQSQAQMEPMVCVAQVKDNYCTIWGGHQWPQTVAKRVAEFLDIPLENVIIHPYRMGGSFGRKYENDFVMEAVQLAQGLDVPVKVVWSREDDMQFGFYQTPSVHHMQCKLTDENTPEGWVHKSVTAPYARLRTQPIDAGDAQGCQAYMVWDLDHYQIFTNGIATDLNRGAHRSVGNPSAQFAIGSFQDELAQLAGKDSIEFFLENLGKNRLLAKSRYEQWIPDDMMYDIGRLRKCIELVTKMSDWQPAPSSGIGMGFSAFRSQLSYCATVVRVKVENDKIRVTHIWNVTDCGVVVDQNGAEQQVVGSLVYGLSCAMREKIYSEEHKVIQSNFHQYQVARIKDMPEVSIEFVESDSNPSGLGEPAVSGVAPALANAIFASTGKRIRELPLADHIEFV